MAKFGHPDQHEHMMRGVERAASSPRTPAHLKAHLQKRLTQTGKDSIKPLPKSPMFGGDEMGVLSTSQRKQLPKSDFAIPGKAPASGSYPVPDASHARNALARVSQFGSPAEKAEVRAKVAKKFPGIGKKKTAAKKRNPFFGE